MRTEFAASVSSVSSEEWNACAGDSNPFVSHQFLSALEESGCVGAETGWIPQPLLLRDEKGQLLGAAPCYLKLHSQGEYIFDYHWADAYHRVEPGRSYYPKLQVAVPFTPVPGPRLLVHPEAPSQAIQDKLLQTLQEHCSERDFSSLHLTYCSREEWNQGRGSGLLPRLGEQYHWFNDNYQSFEDFLGALTSRKRKAIRRERRIAHSHGLTLELLHGEDLTEEQLLWLFRLYENTCLRKWGRPYLNLKFFQILAQRLPRQLVVVLVSSPQGKPVAGAWNLRGKEALFGRNWGCLERFDMLHFEVCYYQAIDYAIAQGLSRVEAGAQGTHKIQRGYQPRPVFSLHHLESKPFAQAIADYLMEERLETQYRLKALAGFQPFRKEDF